MKLTRRGAFQAAVSLPVLGQQHTHSEPSAATSVAWQPRVFSALELAALAEWMDMMIPGAKAANVPLLLDWDATRKPEVATRWREGLKWLGSQSGEKPTVLARISQETGTDGAVWFRALKDTTIDLYYSTREGLRDELGWNANTFLPEFKGCTHPEHQE